MKTIVINATLTTVGPISITMPIAEGQIGNKFNNFPVVTRGLDEDGNRQQTAYLPATTLRGFLRRAIVTDQMTQAAAAGKPYTLQKAYADLIGQDAASESKEDLDLLKLRQTREDNPVLDLFGAGLGIKSRLLVSHFMPTHNVLPEVTTGVRKDLEDTDGVLDLLTSADRDQYLGRSGANSKRAAALAVVKGLEGKIRKAKKAGEDISELELALKEAQGVVERHESAMGDMLNSSRTLTSYYVLPAGVELKGRLVVENARERDLAMIELALNELSKRPILGAQSARGCGEIEGTFDVLLDGILTKKISIGGWQAANMTDFGEAEFPKSAA
jgi:CRISPR/Cas system CSM-associated protein Csm3 (group 7 of RAMP superfamily)